MPFKIVQTVEKGVKKLIIVPSGWESQCQLRYPKKPNEATLVKNENSKPRADWPVLPCKAKRTGFLTYADAEEELTIMLQHSDTDTGTTTGESQRQTQFTMSEIPEFNNMADLLYHSQPKTSNVTQVQPIVDDSYWIIGDSNEIAVNSEPVIPLQPDTHRLNTIIENQNKIMDMQNKFSYRLSNFVIEIETTIDKAITRALSRRLDQSVVNLGDARNAAENSCFKLKPIDSINDLENLELLLMDSEERNKLMKTYSIVCSTADGQGITCAYKLIDLLFTREFLCKCSWSGGSRGSTIKLPLKKYIHILDFCFKLIYSWDKSYTIEDNENFFKLVLRNAEQRKNCKNLRKPSKRNRSNKKQTEKNKMAKIVGTNATVSSDVGSKTKNVTSMRAEVEEETVKEIVMEEKVEEETVNVDGMEEKTINEKDIEEKTINEKDMEEETTNEIDMEDGTTNETDMEEETTNETDMEEGTTNETDMEEETTNETDMVEETTNETDMVEETTNETDMVEETTNETDMVEETTVMEEVAGERVNEKYDNVTEKDSKDISKNVDEKVVKVVQLAEELEKNEMIAKDTETQDDKETKKDIDVKKDMEKNKDKEMYTREVEKEIYIEEKQKAASENNSNEKENIKCEFEQKINTGKINNIFVKKESSRYLPKKQTKMDAEKIKGLHPSSQMSLQNQQSITAIKKHLHDKQLIQASPKRQNLKAVRKKKKLDHDGQSSQTPPKRFKPNATIISEVNTND